KRSRIISPVAVSSIANVCWRVLESRLVNVMKIVYVQRRSPPSLQEREFFGDGSHRDRVFYIRQTAARTWTNTTISARTSLPLLHSEHQTHGLNKGAT